MMITTMTDLKAWARERVYPGGGDVVALGDALADRLRVMDHPAWGSDWGTFLDSVDADSLLLELDGGR